MSGTRPLVDGIKSTANTAAPAYAASPFAAFSIPGHGGPAPLCHPGARGIVIVGHGAQPLTTALCADQDLVLQLESMARRLDRLESQFTTAMPAARRGRRLDKCSHGTSFRPTPLRREGIAHAERNRTHTVRKVEMPLCKAERPPFGWTFEPTMPFLYLQTARRLSRARCGQATSCEIGLRSRPSCLDRGPVGSTTFAAANGAFSCRLQFGALDPAEAERMGRRTEDAMGGA